MAYFVQLKKIYTLLLDVHYIKNQNWFSKEYESFSSEQIIVVISNACDYTRFAYNSKIGLNH